MHETTKLDSAQHNGRGYEASDANAGDLAKYALGLAVICGVALVVVVLLLDYFRAEKKAAEPALSPLAAQREALPPEPRLQIQPEADWDKYQAVEDSLSQTYGWVSREAGVVRLPIDRALELIAQRGLPVRPKGDGREATGDKDGARP